MGVFCVVNVYFHRGKNGRIKDCTQMSLVLLGTCVHGKRESLTPLSFVEVVIDMCALTNLGPVNFTTF